jgi:hypothetical protein
MKDYRFIIRSFETLQKVEGQNLRFMNWSSARHTVETE